MKKSQGMFQRAASLQVQRRISQMIGFASCEVGKEKISATFEGITRRKSQK